MDDTQLVLGIPLLILGAALVMTAVLRSWNRQWSFGVHELWLLPLLGVALILVGRWLIQ